MQDVPTKFPGSTYLSGEYNLGTNDELKNAVESAGITLNSGDSIQLAKAITNYAGAGNYYMDTGTINNYVLSPIAPRPSPTALLDGLKVRFVAANTSTGVATANVGGLGSQDIKKKGGTVQLEGGEIVAGQIEEMTFIASKTAWNLDTIVNQNDTDAIPLFRSFDGMNLSNDIGAPLSDVVVAPGTFKDTDTTRAFTLNSAFAKDLSTALVPGNGNGGRASAVVFGSNKFYHVFLLAKEDGTVDMGFDDQVDASNLLFDASGDGYTFFRRRGSVLTDAASNIRPFLNFGPRFIWISPESISLLPLSTTFIDYIMRVPPGVYTDMTFVIRIQKSGGGGADLYVRPDYQSSDPIQNVVTASSDHNTVSLQFTIAPSQVLEIRAEPANVPDEGADLVSWGWTEIDL